MRIFYLLCLANKLPMELLRIISGYWNPCDWCTEGVNVRHLVGRTDCLICTYCTGLTSLRECEVCKEYCYINIAYWRFCGSSCREWVNALSPACQTCKKRAKKEFKYLYCSEMCYLTVLMVG